MADLAEAPVAPHHLVAPDMREEPRVQVNIDWSQVDVDSIELPEGEDFGIKRYGGCPIRVL